jgi:hypothetical protein
MATLENDNPRFQVFVFWRDKGGYVVQDGHKPWGEFEAVFPGASQESFEKALALADRLNRISQIETAPKRH